MRSEKYYITSKYKESLVMATTSFKLIIQRILQKLINDEGYSQIELFKKFQQLDVDVSRASISNLWNNKSQISLPLLKKAANGLKIVLEREHCLSFNPQTQKFEKLDNCIIRPILQKATTDNTDSPLQSYTIHDGRIDVTDKVSLYNYATYDIIEIGIRLRSFRSYFSSKRESAFTKPLSRKLEAGVNFKCYIMDYQGSWLKRYIEDRAKVQPQELAVLENIEKITTDLKDLFTEINRNGHKGKMELYKYNHFPYYHASIADGDTERGLMYLSPYLYGVSRANSPVLEINRKDNKSIYKRYWQSVKALIYSDQISKIV